MAINLENEWQNITSDVPKPVSEWWWSLLMQKYSESGRNTHDLHYLKENFKEFNSCKSLIKNWKAFGLGLFFQYFEYSGRDTECYFKNIDAFTSFAAEANIGEETDLYKEVRHLLTVHTTEEHKTEGAYGETDLHYFLDIDMAVLGYSEESYDKYIQDLRNEYSFLDPPSYENLRRKVLQYFLQIPNIFVTKFFRDRFEEQAKKNIQQELELLMIP